MWTPNKPKDFMAKRRVCKPEAYVMFKRLAEAALKPDGRLTKLMGTEIRREVVAEYTARKTPTLESLIARYNREEKKEREDIHTARELSVAKSDGGTYTDDASSDEEDYNTKVDRPELPGFLRRRQLKKLNLDDFYTSVSNRRPFVYLITNRNYVPASGQSIRRGAYKDHVRQKAYFSHLNYQVKDYKNLNGTQIEEIVNKFHHSSHRDRCRAIFIFNGHGCEGAILGIDGVKISSEWIRFKIATTPALIGKVKVVSLECCRLLDRRYTAPPLPACLRDNSSSHHADLITVYATSAFHPALRHPKVGTYFVHYFLNEVGEDAGEATLSTLMNRTIKKLRDTPIEYEGKMVHQIPEKLTSTTGELYLPIILL